MYVNSAFLCCTESVDTILFSWNVYKRTIYGYHSSAELVDEFIAVCMVLKMGMGIFQSLPHTCLKKNLKFRRNKMPKSDTQS